MQLVCSEVLNATRWLKQPAGVAWVPPVVVGLQCLTHPTNWGAVLSGRDAWHTPCYSKWSVAKRQI